ncbi:NUDIX hydrolase [Candidatus Jorgensenbacteria bacterium]|nr:NUDIX hydrolase [Candidatus Jorgensenbacteria bacterium]
MQIVCAREPFPNSFTKSIFLAGPTPRSEDVQSWRPEAIRILRMSGYDGVVFVPEDRSLPAKFSYMDQVEWERQALEMADCILFWVPRDLKTLPGFTTNIEFGLYARSGKIVFGAPPLAAHIDYPKWMCDKNYVTHKKTLRETVATALEFVGTGILREGGERYIPLCVWKVPSFQAWYQAQKNVGNRIDGASLEWTFRVGPQRDRIFFWVLHPNIHVASENRNKRNDPIFGRPDISTVVMYCRGAELSDTRVVLIREFRLAATTSDCFIHEVPGGSSRNPEIEPFDVALEEVYEEVGLELDRSRLSACGSRQIFGPYATHKAHVFAYELNSDEFVWIKSQEGKPHGADLDDPSGERAYIEIKTIKDILNEQLVDWSTLGMIMSVLA